jgi:hypothetical protein
VSLRRDRALADVAAPRPSLQLEKFSARNHGVKEVGSFGAASKGRKLTQAEVAAVTERLRAEGRL